MAKLGFYFDSTKCIGCRACQVQCKDKNRLGVGPIYRKTASYCVGAYPDAKCFHLTMSCNHCEKAACIDACPVGAMYKTEDGVVLHDKELCIGCQACITSCPYGHPQYLEDDKKVGKCDSCYAIRKDGGKPACVDSCVMRALDFGDIEELKNKYGNDCVDKLPVIPESETKPALLIKANECAKDKNAKEVWY